MEEAFEYELIDIEFEQPYEQVVFAREGYFNTAGENSVIEYDADGIPMGNSREEIEQRRKIVHEYIQQWRCT